MMYLIISNGEILTKQSDIIFDLLIITFLRTIKKNMEFEIKSTLNKIFRKGKKALQINKF